MNQTLLNQLKGDQCELFQTCCLFRVQTRDMQPTALTPKNKRSAHQNDLVLPSQHQKRKN